MIFMQKFSVFIETQKAGGKNTNPHKGSKDVLRRESSG